MDMSAPATAASGGPAAAPPFAEVFRQHAPYAWRVLRQLGVPEAEVEDLCQEVFVVVHRKLPGFEGRSALSTWIYGICLRTASDHRRRAHVRRESPTDRPPERSGSAPQQREIERRQARAMLEEAVARLNADQRAVFVLYEIEQQTMAQVAQAVGCPLQTAYSRLYAARRIVREAFSAAEAPGGAGGVGGVGDHPGERK